MKPFRFVCQADSAKRKRDQYLGERKRLARDRSKAQHVRLVHRTTINIARCWSSLRGFRQANGGRPDRERMQGRAGSWLSQSSLGARSVPPPVGLHPACGKRRDLVCLYFRERWKVVIMSSQVRTPARVLDVLRGQSPSPLRAAHPTFHPLNTTFPGSILLETHLPLFLSQPPTAHKPSCTFIPLPLPLLCVGPRLPLAATQRHL